MSKLIVGTFLILGWTFYEMSGGADFAPKDAVVATAEPAAVVEKITPEKVAPTVEVTRASNDDLLSLASAEILQATANVTDVVSSQADGVAEIVATVVEEPEVVEIIAEPVLDIRLVAGARVNMRSGPGTDYRVLDTLTGGTETEVIKVNADGWAQVRVIDSDKIGWMAERLLTQG